MWSFLLYACMEISQLDTAYQIFSPQKNPSKFIVAKKLRLDWLSLFYRLMLKMFGNFLVILLDQCWVCYWSISWEYKVEVIDVCLFVLVLGGLIEPISWLSFLYILLRDGSGILLFFSFCSSRRLFLVTLQKRFSFCKFYELLHGITIWNIEVRKKCLWKIKQYVSRYVYNMLADNVF